MLFPLKVGCRWTKRFQSTLHIISRLILWECKLVMSFLFLNCYIFSPTIPNISPTAQEPLWPPSNILYLSCSFPPQVLFPIRSYVISSFWSPSNHCFREAFPDLSDHVIALSYIPLTSPWIEKKKEHFILAMVKRTKENMNVGKNVVLGTSHFLPVLYL